MNVEEPPGAYPKINNTFARWIRGADKWLSDSPIKCIIAGFVLGILAVATRHAILLTSFVAILVTGWVLIPFIRSLIDTLPYIRFSLRSLIITVLCSQIPILVLVNAESDVVLFIGAFLLMAWIGVVGTIIRFGIVAEKIKEQRAITKIQLEQFVKSNNQTPAGPS